MSRSGYHDDIETWSLIRWRGAVASAIRGKRGQAFLREMAAAMDAMPEKTLISDEIVSPYGEVCAIGAVAAARGLQTAGAINPEDRETVARVFNISPALAAEIVYENDEGASYLNYGRESPRWRFVRMRKWIEDNLISSNVQAVEKSA